MEIGKMESQMVREKKFLRMATAIQVDLRKV
jgi:hypothetical protein